MWKLIILSVFALGLSACEKGNSDSSSDELIGRYKGSFSRTAMDTVQVELYFKADGTFEGTGGPSYYPAICSGSYEQNGNGLKVNDTCTWTANFDWTLIFDGTYTVSFSNGGNSVTISRINRSARDEYLLDRISR